MPSQLCDIFRLALELKKASVPPPIAVLSSPKRCGEVIDLGRGIKARYGSSDSPLQKDVHLPPEPQPSVKPQISTPVNPPPLPTQGEATHDAFLTAIRAFTRLPTQPPVHPLPPG